jgi:predicted ATPase
MHLKCVTLNPDRYPVRDTYPFHLAAFQQTKGLRFETPVTLFTGENGTGKSTLLEAIARRCGIHIWQAVEGRRIRRNPYEKKFCEYISVEWSDGRVPGSFFGSAVFRDFARIIEEWAAADPGQLDYLGGRSFLTQSHGQSVMSFFRARYAIRGLYLMDEPETALSPRSQIELLEFLAAAGRPGTSSSSWHPLRRSCWPAPGRHLQLRPHPIAPVNYEDTENYRLYRSLWRTGKVPGQG